MSQIAVAAEPDQVVPASPGVSQGGQLGEYTIVGFAAIRLNPTTRKDGMAQHGGAAIARAADEFGDLASLGAMGV